MHRRITSSLLILALIVPTAVLLAAGRGAAVIQTWSLPERLPGSLRGSDVLAGADSQGVVSAVWSTNARVPPYVVGAQRSADGTWTAPEPITDLAAGLLDFDIGPNDVQWALLRHRGRIYAARREPGNAWSAPELVASTRRFGPPQLDASGPHPVVAWISRETRPRRLVASIRAADGSWASPRTISQLDREVGLRMDLEVSADGVATFVWLQHPAGDRRKRVWLRERLPDGSWTARLPLSPRDVGAPDLSVAGDGSAAVGWTRHDGGSIWRPQVAVRNRAGRWKVTLVDNRPLPANGLKVLAQPGAAVFAGWSSPSRQPLGRHVWVAAKTARSWEPAARISPRDGDHGDVEFAVKGDGTVRAVWTGEIVPTISGNLQIVMSRAWLGDGWGFTAVISSGHATRGDLAVALTPDGRGCVIFGAYDPETGYTIQSSCVAEFS